MRLADVKWLSGATAGVGNGAGLSAKLWIEFLPNADIWMADANAECHVAPQADLKELELLVPHRSQILAKVILVRVLALYSSPCSPTTTDTRFLRACDLHRQ